MSTQPINNPSIENHTKPVILSKMQWLGRQISTFGKTLYSQLTKITHLFYQTIKTHPKKTLAILTAAAVTPLVYYKGKALVTFLKSLNKEPKEKVFQRTIDTLSKQFSDESKKLEQQFTVLEKSVQAVFTAQKAIDDSITNAQFQIATQYHQIQEDLKKLIESTPQENALPEEKIALLETNIQNLLALKQKTEQLIIETSNQNTRLAPFLNPFES
ncbi:MAG TPA: hypothetical protein VGZ69_05175 [Candidatus Rhabdochlamydia sp.]|jgi:hypothetical protein|nr:hypothetical protein [Candidatus Rhabdochlamydia sp.]